MFEYKSLSAHFLDSSLHELGIWPDLGDWVEPAYRSHLVSECRRLRHVKLREYNAEDLRIMIGQQIGLECLIPLALDQLETDPWVFGDVRPGDLLDFTTTIGADFWLPRSGLKLRMDAVVKKALDAVKFLDPEYLEWDTIQGDIDRLKVWKPGC